MLFSTNNFRLIVCVINCIALTRTSDPRAKSILDPRDDRRETSHVTYTRVKERGMRSDDQ